MPTVHRQRFLAGHSASGVPQMSAHAPQLTADVLHFFDAPLRIGNRIVKMVTQGFQHIFHVHCGEGLIQRRHAYLLETFHSGGGTSGDSLPQAVQCPLELVCLVFQRCRRFLRHILNGRFPLLVELLADILQFPEDCFILPCHSIHIPHEGGQISRLALPVVSFQQFLKLLNRLAAL